MAEIYIDPSAAVDGSGSYASPRNVVPTIGVGNTYLFKRGTRALLSAIVAISTGDNSVRLKPYGEGAQPILDAQGTLTSVITVAACSHVEVRDLKLVGATNVNGAVVINGTTDDVVFDGCTVEAVQTVFLVSGSGVTNCHIRNCVTTSAQMDNQAFEFAGPGAGCSATGNTITHSGATITGSSLSGIYLNGGSPVIVEDNTISGFNIGIESRCDSSKIRRNNVSGCASSGIRLRDTDSNVVEDNTLSDIWNGLPYDGGAGAGSGGGTGAGIDVLDISDACLNNRVSRNKIFNCYQGYVDQSDVGGANDFESNLIIYPRVNGVNYQGDGALSRIWFNTVIHRPRDPVNPTGHAFVVQSGSTTTEVSFKYNIAICDLLGDNIQCLSIGGTAGTNYLTVELEGNIWYTKEGAHMCGLAPSAVTAYDTIETWKAAIASITQITIKEVNSVNGDPNLDATYAPRELAFERGRGLIGLTDVYGNARRNPGTAGAVEYQGEPRRVACAA